MLGPLAGSGVVTIDPLHFLTGSLTHWSLSASQAGPVHESAAVGKLVNAALLSLIDEVCVNVLPSS